MVDINKICEQTEDRIDSLELEMRTVDAIPGCLIVSMRGYIDSYNTPHFRQRVNEAIRRGSIRLVFDFSSITYISSAGIGAFTQFLKQVKPLGGNIVLVGLTGRVLEGFQLLGFVMFFHTETSLDAAVADLNVHRGSKNGTTFPATCRCPICGKRLRTIKVGRFRCPDCRTILLVRENAEVSLG